MAHGAASRESEVRHKQYRAFHDNGGFELVDLATMDSLGLVVREQEEAGADAGAFTMVDEVLQVSADQCPNRHVARSRSLTVPGRGAG